MGNEKLKVVTLFSGIGSQEAALHRLKIPFEMVAFCEIDKYAIQSYRAMWGEDIPNLGDISKLDKLPFCDLVTYSFPCQDISVCGKQRGLVDEKGNQTRSGLLTEVERLLETAKSNNEMPKYLLMENVKNLVGKKFKSDFDRWLSKLEELGYNNYWQVLNAKNYGIPQNRERVFAMSIRKDIDKHYEFPKPIPLKQRLKDVLERDVDEKYYLSDKIVDRFKQFDKPIGGNVVGTTKPSFRTIGQRDNVYGVNGVMGCLAATGYKQPKQIAEPFIAASRGRNPENPSDRTVGSPTEQRLEPNSQGICNTLTTVQKDNYVVEPKTICLNSKGGRGGVEGLQPSIQDRVYSVEGISTAITCSFQTNILEPKRLGGLYDTETQKRQAGAIWDKNAISPTLDTMQGDNRQPMIVENTNKVMQIGNITDTTNCSWDNPQRGRIYSQEGISPALNTCGGGGLEPKIVESNNIIRLGNCSQDTDSQAGMVYSTEGVSMTITAGTHGYAMGNIAENKSCDIRIRKLTPRECWRLMAFTDEEFDKAQATGVSNSQLYKMAGNSIVVNCLVAIFFNLFFDKETKSWKW